MVLSLTAASSCQSTISASDHISQWDQHAQGCPGGAGTYAIYTMWAILLYSILLYFLWNLQPSLWVYTLDYCHLNIKLEQFKYHVCAYVQVIELLPLLTRTHCRCGVNSALGGGCQSLLHHAGQAVELVLLIDLKQAQKLPLLPQTSPPPPLHCAGALTATRRLQVTCGCWHLHLGHRKMHKSKTNDCYSHMTLCWWGFQSCHKKTSKIEPERLLTNTRTADCQLNLNRVTMETNTKGSQLHGPCCGLWHHISTFKKTILAH